MEAQRVQMKEFLLGCFVVVVVPVYGTSILSWLLLSASTKYFSSPYTISIYVCFPVTQQSGQVVVQGRLSLYVCLWFSPLGQMIRNEMRCDEMNMTLL
jgi:hypothetical protein